MILNNKQKGESKYMSLNMTVVRSFARTFSEDELVVLIRKTQEALIANKGGLTSASTSGTSYTRQGVKDEAELLELYEAALAMKRGESVVQADDVSQVAGVHFVNMSH